MTIKFCLNSATLYNFILFVNFVTPFDTQEYVSDLGVSNDNHVIIYDDHSKHAVFSAPRLWWMFHTFGHSNVSILNGGLTSWMKFGHPHTSGPYTADEDVASKF